VTLAKQAGILSIAKITEKNAERIKNTGADIFIYDLLEIITILSESSNADQIFIPISKLISLSKRRVANMLEMVGMKEGHDFRITPESDCLTPKGVVDPEVLKYNLVLLGGPKRNKVTHEILKRSAKLRYDMQLDSTGENRFYDRVAKHEFRASRDDPVHSGIDDNSYDGSVGCDYGLIMSMPNPLHLDRGVLLLAGIHGPGTAGAALYISDRSHLAELCRRRKGGIIQEAVCVKHSAGADRIIEVSLI
jgi:hypothetical protein